MNDIVRILRGKYAGKLGEVTKVNTFSIKDEDGKNNMFTKDVCLRVEGVHYPNQFSKIKYLVDNLELFMTREERAKTGYYLVYRMKP